MRQRGRAKDSVDIDELHPLSDPSEPQDGSSDFLTVGFEPLRDG
jgi:hypothetical protein